MPHQHQALSFQSASSEHNPVSYTHLVFHGETGVRMEPNAEDVAGFDAFIQRYKECLPVERAAVENLPL